MSFFEHIKRRNTSRAGIAYTVAAWLPIQVTDTVFPRIGFPGSAVTRVTAFFINEQDGPSMARLHVAAKARVGTSLCQGSAGL